MNDSKLNKNTGSNTKRFILWTLILILTLAVGGVGGYFLGMTNKDQEVQLARAEAEDEAAAAAAAARAEAEKKKAEEQAKAPAKPVTETTCNADELSLTTGDSGQSGAGTLSYNLVLTNIGKRTCILGGFPGVSLVNNNGNMIGTPAERIANSEEKKLTLAPNTKVKAVVSIGNSTNFPDGECKDGATKFRVYPPNDTGYLSVATPAAITAWCPGFKISPVTMM